MLKSMPGIKIFDERTGNPTVDNMHRAMNRSLHRVCRNAFHVKTSKGRKRKKYITRVEYPRYLRIVVSAAEGLADADQP